MSVPWRKNVFHFPALKCDECGEVIYNQNRRDRGSILLVRMALERGWKATQTSRSPYAVGQEHTCSGCNEGGLLVHALKAAKYALEYDPDFVDGEQYRAKALRLLNKVLLGHTP